MFTQTVQNKIDWLFINMIDLDQDLFKSMLTTYNSNLFDLKLEDRTQDIIEGDYEKIYINTYDGYLNIIYNFNQSNKIEEQLLLFDYIISVYSVRDKTDDKNFNIINDIISKMDKEKLSDIYAYIIYYQIRNNIKSIVRN